MKKEIAKTKNEEPPATVLLRLSIVAFSAVLLFFFLVYSWQDFFKNQHGALDQKHPLGFSVLFLLAATSHALIWGLVAPVSAALVRDYTRCVGAWFDYALRLVLTVVVIEILVMLCNLSGEMRFSIANAERSAEVAMGVLRALATLDIVGVLMAPESSGNLMTGALVGYLVYLVLLTSYIRNLFLPEKEFKFFIAAFLLLILSFLLSFAYYVISPVVGKDLTKPLFHCVLWRMKTHLDVLSMIKVLVNWSAFLFGVVIMKTIFPDAKNEVIEVAAPVLRSPGQTRS